MRLDPHAAHYDAHARALVVDLPPEFDVRIRFGPWSEGLPCHRWIDGAWHHESQDPRLELFHPMPPTPTTPRPPTTPSRATSPPCPPNNARTLGARCRAARSAGHRVISSVGVRAARSVVRIVSNARRSF